MKYDVISTDFLCAGGGIAGLMAAIRARRQGIDVIVADKSNTNYSGSAGAGNDDFMVYMPEFHGPDMEAYIKDCQAGQMGKMFKWLGPDRVRTWLGNTADMVRLWEEWGIPMRFDGKYVFAGHSFPGRMRTNLKYSGKHQKKILTQTAEKHGVKILNRTMVFDLLGSEQGVAGALAYNTHENRLIEIRAKAVLLGTGRFRRIFQSPVPSLLNNEGGPASLTGDGRAMAYRLGAEIRALDSFERHVGIKNFIRGGQGTWIGVYRYPDGKPIGKYVSKPDRYHGDITPEADKSIFARIIEQGRGPVYMDCRGISDEDLAFLIHWLRQEGNEALVEYLEKEGIDLRRNPVEFMTYHYMVREGIWIDTKAQTNIPGLYAAGDEVTRSISPAAVFGWIAGETASDFIGEKNTAQANTEKGKEAKIKLEGIFARKKGFDWKDANFALQQVMTDYLGTTRSEDYLSAGLSHLRRLKRQIHENMMAADGWELARCLEVFNLYDLGEMMFLGALERKESRGLVHRVDYPYPDPLVNDKHLFVRKANNRFTAYWK